MRVGGDQVAKVLQSRDVSGVETLNGCVQSRTGGGREIRSEFKYLKRS